MAGHVDPGELDALFGALSTIFVLSPSAMALALNTMLGDKVLDGSMLSPGPILEYYLGSLHRCAVDITQGKISGDDFRSQAYAMQSMRESLESIFKATQEVPRTPQMRHLLDSVASPHVPSLQAPLVHAVAVAEAAFQAQVDAPDAFRRLSDWFKPHLVVPDNVRSHVQQLRQSLVENKAVPAFILASYNAGALAREALDYVDRARRAVKAGMRGPSAPASAAVVALPAPSYALAPPRPAPSYPLVPAYPVSAPHHALDTSTRAVPIVQAFATPTRPGAAAGAARAATPPHAGMPSHIEHRQPQTLLQEMEALKKRRVEKARAPKDHAELWELEQAFMKPSVRSQVPSQAATPARGRLVAPSAGPSPSPAHRDKRLRVGYGAEQDTDNEGTQQLMQPVQDLARMSKALARGGAGPSTGAETVEEGEPGKKAAAEVAGDERRGAGEAREEEEEEAVEHIQLPHHKRHKIQPLKGSGRVGRAVPDREPAAAQEGHLMTAAEDQGGAEGAAADGAPGPASQGAGAGAGAGGADGFSGLSAINRRRKRLAWVQAETNELKKLHEKHGNQWHEILEKGKEVFHPSRTSVDLKDKWRNLILAARKRGEDLRASSDAE